jgi:hypothetical protein
MPVARGRGHLIRWLRTENDAHHRFGGRRRWRPSCKRRERAEHCLAERSRTKPHRRQGMKLPFDHNLSLKLPPLSRAAAPKPSRSSRAITLPRFVSRVGLGNDASG